MNKFITTVIAVHVGIFTGGLLLNAAGEGMLGTTAQGLASKITKGYGV